MIPIIDAHLDLSWSALQWNRDLTLSVDQVRSAEAHMTDHRARGRNTVTLPELRRARVRLCLGTVLVRSKPEVCPPAGFNRRDLDFRNQHIAASVGRGQVQYYQLLEELGEIVMIRTREDLQSFWEQKTADGPIGLILAMEGADPILTPQHAREWWDLGLRCVGLSHYAQGPYAMGTGAQGPVTPVGRELLREFQKLGMIVDLTHCAEPGFFEIVDHYEGPVLASHNMCRKLVPGDRQFSDEQIHRLIQRNAVIGMAFDAWMLSPGWVIHKSHPSEVSIEAAADHIDHICQLAGNTQHVGIGSDLDGGFGTEQTPGDLDTIADLQKLTGILSRRGYSQPDIEAIFFGNFLRLFSLALPQGGSTR
ncbi:dipeptidase [Planctomicrobium sp. SH664]|uniref:dipeptidase n=1 Tax=Planctomicrobium sp. SH664 TaxID=3448125 RepID=UPI003F5CAE2B